MDGKKSEKLKRKCHYFDEIFVIGWAGCCQNGSMRPANERCRYEVTSSLVGWSQTSVLQASDEMFVKMTTLFLWNEEENLCPLDPKSPSCASAHSKLSSKYEWVSEWMDELIDWLMYLHWHILNWIHCVA